MTATVVVADYGLGNIVSVTRAFERAGANVVVATDVASAVGAAGLVFCGVGNFGAGIRRLSDTGWMDVMKNWAAQGKPLFGICLGMQMMFESSEEQPDLCGAGIFQGHVRKLNAPIVPHMGWARVSSTRDLLRASESEYFYFVHSYVVVPNDASIVAANADYSGVFCAAVSSGHIVGTQFHPEKSSRAGSALLTRWVQTL